MILAETLVDADDVVGIVGDYFVDGAIPMQVSMSDAEVEVAEAGANAARQVSMLDAEVEVVEAGADVADAAGVDVGC